MSPPARALVPVVDVEALTFRWPRATHDCLDIGGLRLEAGEAVFLRGPSGSGKSTLLSLIAGVLAPSSGHVRLLGRDLGACSGRERDRLRADHVGYIFQQFNLLPYRSALDNVLLACEFSRRRATLAGQPRERARTLLRRMGLGDELIARRASALSVGQQQRVAAARALIGHPDLVIADEPTSALDDAHRDGFMATLREACLESGSALLFVSHDARLAARFPRVLDLPMLQRPPSRGGPGQAADDGLSRAAKGGARP
ncbi:ABC transporter ATP-binding protein [Roseateles chitosanitabidus]|jgi:putative ABC transport system ATP-binding protein|uniref:ABC transporter ATP-binding protein n=1 Tax=Roseateles chitosanitabidus TaxID=65048 RepID=UPI000A03BE71|nr:ABC transporter ATP-binding protein [Roseateles chitosanitabidus]MBO9685586.1 ABC transporter ATP-binding protein [Roseateles chitosanitabidus]